MKKHVAQVVVIMLALACVAVAQGGPGSGWVTARRWECPARWRAVAREWGTVWAWHEWAMAGWEWEWAASGGRIPNWSRNLALAIRKYSRLRRLFRIIACS